MDALLIDADAVRQIFNDTRNEQVWLVMGAPREQFRIPDLTEQERSYLYPDGLQSLPPELRPEP